MELDPQVINLAKSIRQVESNNNPIAIGSSGEYGAYQWLPSSWDNMSQSAGINVPLKQASLEQQNQVAYTQIKKWKDEGYDVGQIASLWNSGDPNAYSGTFSNGLPAEGTNSSGANYDVPNYAHKVATIYQSLKSSQPQTSNPLNIPVANASNGSNQSSSQPDWLSALEGLGVGGLAWLFGHGSNIIKNTIPDVVGGAVGGSVVPGIGTLEGGVAGLGEGLIRNTIGEITGGSPQNPQQPITGGQSQQTPQNQPIDLSVPQASKESDLLKNAIMQTMQGTQPNRIFSQSKPGQDAINTASTFGLIHPDENGNLVFNDEKRKKMLKEVANADDKIIAAEGGKGHTLSVRNYAGNYIGQDRGSTPVDREKAAQIVQKEIQARKNVQNGQMSLSDMREAQKEHYASAKGKYGVTKTSAEILAHKALGNAYGQVIRDNLKNPTLHDKVLKMEQDLIRVEQLGKKLHGKRAPKNDDFKQQILRYGVRAAEIYIGEKVGGTIGAILGGLVGEHFNRKITSHYGSNIFETKGMKAALELLEDNKPEIYNRIVEELKKEGIDASVNKKSPGSTEGLVRSAKENLKAMSKEGLIKKKNPGALINLKTRG